MLAAVLYAKHDLRIEESPDRPLAPDEVRVRVAYGGICGSDLHYYHRGAVGNFAVREPMILGHEVSGTVAEVGADVIGIEPGTVAALDPSKPCRVCRYCIAGRSNLCERMRFLGSASLFPHVGGGFAQHLVLRQDQIVSVPEGTDLLRLACAEPLSVALHAVNRAGPLVGKRVLVTGSGPIGLLTMLAARQAGAIEVVATDIEDYPLTVACDRMGATATINVLREAEEFDRYASGTGHFDVAFEASGSVAALASLFTVVARGGRIVQLGMLPPGPASIPVNVLQSREFDLVGAFRAHDEFRTAVSMIVDGLIDVTPILSGVYELDDARDAFDRAGDRTKVVKLHLAL